MTVRRAAVSAPQTQCTGELLAIKLLKAGHSLSKTHRTALGEVRGLF